MDWVLRNLGFGSSSTMKKWFLKGFSFFGIFDDFFKVEHYNTLNNPLRYAENLAKNEEEPCSTCQL